MVPKKRQTCLRKEAVEEGKRCRENDTVFGYSIWTRHAFLEFGNAPTALFIAGIYSVHVRCTSFFPMYANNKYVLVKLSNVKMFTL